MLGGVLQELRGEVQKFRPAVREPRRQAVLLAALAVVVVVVVMVVVSVGHHPSHQVGHGVFNFADHHRRRTDTHGQKTERRNKNQTGRREEGTVWSK